MRRGLGALVAVLGSLRLTVALFAMAMVLIFAGTLAQVRHGIWIVMEHYFRTFWTWIDLQLFVPPDRFEIHGGFPFPGGFTIGGLLIANLLVAHATRFKMKARGGRLAGGLAVIAVGVGCLVGLTLWQTRSGHYGFLPLVGMIAVAAGILYVGCMLLFQRRAGIVLLHAGVILLLASEFVTAAFAEEGNMTIDEGETTRYVEDIRAYELAFIDRSPEDHNRVVAIPGERLAAAARSGGRIEHPRLPVSLRVDRWMKNSRVFRASRRAQATSDATRGEGTGLVARETAPVTGVGEQNVNAPSAVVTLFRDGKKLGRWLVSLYIEQLQSLDAGEGDWAMALRFERHYKPYAMKLLDFQHEKFVGTEKPKAFRSELRLRDPRADVNRRVEISMNQPLRYAGETFYQSGFKPDNKGTILQVVRNPGWLIPYIACVTIAVGMGLHLGGHLVGFVRRTRGRNA